MKPPRFDYLAAASLDEALTLLERYGDDAKVLAGGQSLVPLMNMRLAQPRVLVDINGVPGLNYIREQDGQVAIGALTRHRSVLSSALLASQCPLLSAAAEHVADTQVRNRGTFGGSISHADPAAEFPSVAYTLEATIVCSGPDGSREVPAEEFIVGPLTTSLESTEIVTEVRLPSLVGRGWSYRSIARRHGDFAIAGVMVALATDPDGGCWDVRLGMFGVSPTPVRARQTEALLEGRRLDDGVLQQAADTAAGEAEPEADLRGSAEYRRKLLRVLVPQCLREAVDRA